VGLNNFCVLNDVDKAELNNFFIFNDVELVKRVEETQRSVGREGLNNS
jgi:hypothetical protein